MTPIRGPDHDGGGLSLGRAHGSNSPYQSGRSQCNTLTRSNNPRPPYLAATDYIFYIKRQTAACQAAMKSTDAHEASMEELTNFTDLMRRLKDDLKSSYSSFVEEFAVEPNDGVGLLLDLLKIYRRGNQQEHLGHPLTLRNNKDRQHIIKKNMSEELDCIECLFYTLRCKKSLTKLVAHSSGMTSVASSVMSTCTTTRKLALQLMSRVIEEHPAGYQKVMDSISAVRVIHGETVRFKFLVSMLLNRSKMAAGFEFAALHFLNCVHTYTPSASDKIRIQNELDEAGFDTAALEKNLFEKGFATQDPVWDEVRRWKENFLNVEHALAERKKIKNENTKLKTELELLRRALKRLEVDKISLMTIEKELKERCEGLELEVCALKKAAPSKTSSAKSSDTEDSDHSDNTQGTTDSGRSSFKDYAHRKIRASSRAGNSASSGSAAASPTVHSPDHQQSDSGDEEADLLQIPTIRPPEGFATDQDDLSVVEPTKVSVVGYVQKSSESPIGGIHATGALRNESDLDWNYPIIPEPKVLNSRPPSRAHSATFSVASSSNARTMSIISNC